MNSAEDLFFPNDDDDLHCLQACYQMLVARATGTAITVEQAERETGFQPGKLTWQFAMLNSLAQEHGLFVTDYESFDPRDFVEDPIASLRRQIGDDEEAIQYQIENSDLPQEAERARTSIKDKRIKFIDGAPRIQELQVAVEHGLQVVCLVNGHVLDDEAGYRPHFVVLRAMTDASVEFDDPGPPPHPVRSVPRSTFERAWADPTASVTNFISCGAEHFKAG